MGQIQRQAERIANTPFFNSDFFNYAVVGTGLGLIILLYIFTQAPVETEAPGPQPPAAIEIDFALVAAGGEARSYPERQEIVVSTREAWEKVWARLQMFTIPHPAVPDIDFSEQMVLVVLAGEKERGYMVRVRRVNYTPEAEVVVHVVEQQVKPNDQLAKEVIWPYQVVTIPRIDDLPVRFEFH